MFFSAKRWDRRNRVDPIESGTPCHDAQVVGPYRDSNPLRLTVLAAMSEDYTTAPKDLQEGRGKERRKKEGRKTFFPSLLFLFYYFIFGSVTHGRGLLHTKKGLKAQKILFQAYITIRD